MIKKKIKRFTFWPIPDDPVRVTTLRGARPCGKANKTSAASPASPVLLEGGGVNKLKDPSQDR